MDKLCKECERLRAENARLAALLEQNGIPCVLYLLLLSYLKVLSHLKA